MSRDDSAGGVIDGNRRAILESAVTLGLASAVSQIYPLSAAGAPTPSAHLKPTVGIQIDVNTLVTNCRIYRRCLTICRRVPG